jgi:hypothetical protein
LVLQATARSWPFGLLASGKVVATAGIVKWNTDPLPSALSTQIFPLCISMI